MNLWNFSALFTLVLFFFQSCGSFESIALPVFYPYTTKPDFFYDLKLISAETDDLNRRQYMIDIAMSYSQDPEQSIDYEVQFSTLKIANVCPTQNGSAVADKKRILAQCLIPISDENLFVQFILQGPDNKSLRKIYKF